jgi:TP901 family phage tail tape measure protein
LSTKVGELFVGVKVDLEKTNKQFESLKGSFKGLGADMSKVGSSMSKVGQNLTSVGKTLTSKLTIPILGFAAGSVKTAAEFEAAMSKVSAISGASGQDLKKLSTLAREMGATTKFSAKESAEALKYMAMAGWKTTEMMDGLPGILNLAAASGEDLARVSDIVTDALTAFGMKANDSAKFADLLASVSSNANTNVSMMGETFKYVAPVAGALGYTAEDTALAIGLMANAGIKASKSGTSLRGGLTNLVKPTDKAAEIMKKYGINIENTDGTMKSLKDVMVMLREKLGGLTAAQQGVAVSTIFGKNAMSGWLAVINATEEDFGKLTKATREYEGAADRMAKEMLNNLNGQLKIIQSSLEELAIQVGNVLLPVVKMFAWVFQRVITVLVKLPTPTKAVVIIIGLMVAAIGPLLLVLGLLITQIASLVTVLSVIGLKVAVIVIAVFAQMAIAIGLVSAAFVYLLNKLIPITDTFRLLNKLIKADFNGTVEILSKRFGMTREEAEKLTKVFADVKNKAWQIWQVIKNNLNPIFQLIQESIGNTIKSFFNFNTSTEETQKNVVGLIKKIIIPFQGLINKIYDTLDAFGLIPHTVKFANDATARSFIELNANTRKHLDGLISMSAEWSDKMGKTREESYKKQHDATVKALNAEYEFVKEHMQKKHTEQIEKTKKVLTNIKSLDDAAKTKVMEANTKHYADEINKLEERNRRIQELIAIDKDASVQITREQVMELNQLLAEGSDEAVRIISNNKRDQQVILEEAKNLAVITSREQGMAIIVEANKTYDETIKTARKQKEDTIKEAIFQRDVIGSINEEQAKKAIQEANETYKSVTFAAKKTKEDTIQEAILKSNGVIGESDKEARQVTGNSEKIKKALPIIWKDIKKEVIKIVNDLVDAIITALGNKLKSGIKNRMNQAGEELKKGLKNMFFSIPSPGEAASRIIKGQPIFQDVRKRATGGTVREDMTLVGERGAELVSLPHGSKVHTASQTKNMLSGISGAGSPLMKQFASGINSESRNVMSSIISLTNSIGDYFPASPAKKGALKNASKWGVELVNQIAGGIIKSNSKIKNTANKISSFMAVSGSGFWDIREFIKRYERDITKIRNATKEATKDNKQDFMKQFNDNVLRYMEDLNSGVKSKIQDLENRVKSYMNVFSLFNRVERKAIPGAVLRNNLESQVKAMQEWKNEMARIGKKIGTDSGLHNQLEDMGMTSFNELRALNRMTDQQLQEYSELYRKKGVLAEGFARSDIDSELRKENKINNLVVNITGNQIKDDYDIERIANLLIKKLKLEGVY